MPKWVELRTATMPRPQAFAFSMAMLMALFAITMPMPLCPSSTAVEGVSRTVSISVTGFRIPARIRSI